MIIRTLGRSLWYTQLRYSSSSTYSDRLYQPIISEGYEGIKKLIIPKDTPFSNQSIAVEDSGNLTDLVERFEAPIKLSFGYGSGVFEQAGYDKKNDRAPQIDLIYMVENGQTFHEKNLKQFPQHYSGMKFLGSGTISKFQDIGAGIYFNPFVTMENHSIKYGAVSIDKALLDLSEWSSLYLAGRLQKPVSFLTDNENESYSIIKYVNQFNLKNAMTLAFLLIKNDKFNEVELYETITKISYLGDFRFIVGGENPNKVKNIVNKQFQNFKILYEPILNYFINRNLIIITDNSKDIREFKKNMSIESKTNLISKLPIKFRKSLYYLYKDKSIREIAKDENLHINLTKVIKKLVRFPSFVQMIKGIFSAGIVKSIRYAVEKKVKSWKA